MKVPYRDFDRLVSFFSKVPGIGSRGALRVVLYLAQMDPSKIRNLAKALLNVVDGAERCALCNNLSFSRLCWVCSDEERDRSLIMVVETVMDLLVMEETGYRGLYHVVAGLVPSIRKIPDREKSKSLSMLLRRLDGVREVILAFPYTVRGESLAKFFHQALLEKDVLVSRIARGIPTGAEVEYMDASSLSYALSRRERL